METLKDNPSLLDWDKHMKLLDEEILKPQTSCTGTSTVYQVFAQEGFLSFPTMKQDIVVLSIT